MTVLTTDHECVLNFAKALEVDFEWMLELIDGRREAGVVLADALSLKTGTPAKLWKVGGCSTQRLIAVKDWHEKHLKRN